MTRVLVLALCLACRWLSAEAPHATIYAQRAPAVVGITCTGTTQGHSGGFYGTGVVVSSDGLVLSSTTVVPADAKEIRIFFTDGRIVPASLLATDAASEGALMRLAGEHRDLAHMPLADSAACAVGDPVYSWGNPYWTIQQDGGVSLSVGRISALAQIASVDDQSRYRGPVLETDAAVNPGSDGGPLTDSDGNLIGLQSLAFSERRWLGLAVPTAALRAGLDELAKLPMKRPAGNAGPAWQRERALLAAVQPCGDAVVGIWVERRGDSLAPPASRADEAPGERPVIARNQRPLRERLIPEGCCTGFIVDASGLVATAALNIVDRALPNQSGKKKKKDKNRAGTVERIWIFTADGVRHPATLLGRDDSRDLAVLRIDGDGGPWPAIPVPASDPGDLAIGQGVALLGRSEAPGALHVNLGSLSALQRNRNLHLQISALMNYGNTGGPVIDAQGRLLGMANKLAPASTWRQNCGVGFCLKSSLLAEAIPVLAKGGSLPKLSIPVIGIQLDPDADGPGARIASVVEDGPAATAGIQDGDVVVAIADEPVDSFIDLANRIQQSRPGQQLALIIQRGEERLPITVTVGSDTDDWATAGAED